MRITLVAERRFEIMGSEKQTWRNLKKGLDYIKGIQYQRFEDALSCGIPDLMVCAYGRTTFVELKQRDGFPKRGSTPIRLDYRRNQFTWGRNHAEAGGRYLLIAQVGHRYYVFQNVVDLLLICEERYNAKEFRICSINFGDVPALVDFITKG